MSVGGPGLGTISSYVNRQYDSRGRLVTESRASKVSGTIYRGGATYSYDAADNLNSGTNGWQYNSLNQLTSAPPVAGMVGATNITYGTGGVLSGMNGRTFQYSSLGQLSQVSQPASGGAPSGTTTIVYDPIGRVWSVTDTSGVTRNYDYDGTTLVGEQSRAGAGGYRSYVSGSDGYIGDYTNGTSGTSGQQFYNYDVSGNLSGVYANPGTVLWSLQNGMDQWGNPQEGPGG